MVISSVLYGWLLWLIIIDLLCVLVMLVSVL